MQKSSDSGRIMKEITERRKDLKKKLLSGGKVYAGWTSIGHPVITEIMARTGVDFIGIDIEHSTISQEQSQRIIAACHQNGIVCLPRIASHNMEMIKRLLDSGADGIIVPMINSPEEVEDIVRWAKYTPLGSRSYGISRAQGYGFDFDDYCSEWNDSSIIIVQIESKEGVENIDAILSNPYIDGAMIGPYDLSGSLGIPGQIEDPRIVEAGKKVIDSCKRHKKGCGTQLVEPDEKNMEEAFSYGFSFIVMSSDVFLLWKWSEKTRSLIGKSNSKK